MSKLLVFALILLHFNRIIICREELLSVVVLYRHGDRTPLKSYSYDIYDESYWPDDFGQLTNIGKEQQYNLGKWLRKRYDGFLPKKYNRKDIKVYSSDMDRCLMSAAANLAGLYPPEEGQWSEKLGWQPIPIHTKPKEEDELLAQHKPCPKYKRLYDELMQTEMFQDMFREYSELFEYLSVYSGEVIQTFEQVLALYNVLYVEDLHNLTLPLWTRPVFPGQLERICNFGLKCYTHHPILAVLKSGPLIDYITTHLENRVASGVRHAPKFLMLSAHDTTVAHLLNSLNIFNDRWPPYACSVIFELKKREDYYVVNIFYKNSTEAMKMSLPNCDFDCNFDVFLKLVQPVRISSENWLKECSDG